MTASRAVFIKTYGCQMNAYDSERMGYVLAGAGYRRTEDPGAADLIVAGAPLMALRLPTEKMVEGIVAKPGEPAVELDQPTMRAWLAGLPWGRGAGAAFETKLRWSPGGATGALKRSV